jgi:hypothetical protein
VDFRLLKGRASRVKTRLFTYFAGSEAKRPVIPTEGGQSDPKRPVIPIEGGAMI